MPTWRLPTDTDLDNLESNVCGDAGDEGSALAGHYDLWSGGDLRDDNDFDCSGFDSLPGGYRHDGGIYYNLNHNTYLWSLTKYDPTDAWDLNVSYYYTAVYRNHPDKDYGQSVRCLRNTTEDESSDDDGTIYTDDYTGNDGKTYDSVKIGDQVWITENLMETKYEDGSDVPRITNDTDWDNDTDGARCEYNNDSGNESDTYGYLYNWFAVDNDSGLVNGSGSASNLLAHWKMDEGSWNGTGGEVVDSSVNGYNATASGNATTVSGGILDRCGSFDGSGDYVDCGNDAAFDLTSALTVACWIKPNTSQEVCSADGTSGNYGVAGKVEKHDNSTNWSWQIRYGSPDSCRLGFQVNDSGGGGVWATVGRELNKYTWYHIAVTCSGTDMKFYMNGNERDSNILTGGMTSNENNLLIGTEGWANDFDGEIDDFRVYDKALTRSEIRDLAGDPQTTGPFALFER